MDIPGLGPVSVDFFAQYRLSRRLPSAKTITNIHVARTISGLLEHCRFSPSLVASRFETPKIAPSPMKSQTSSPDERPSALHSEVASQRGHAKIARPIQASADAFEG